MDAVRAFNNELSSLYESKPPVSRAKMAQVTKFAIKAIKFYKHVVQSVEKFIQKCKPEYKVPGLYVIDSIVRQSRHQFGPEKDVFSPRFTKNIVTTFTHLFKCAVEERSRVVRVLNLWQKNSVFSMDIIQPLLDLAANPDNPELVSAAHAAINSVVSSSQKVPLPTLTEAQPSSNGRDTNPSTQVLQQSEMLSTITKLLKQAQEGTITNKAPETQLQQLQHLQQQLVMQTERIAQPEQQAAPPIDSNLLAQIQMLTSQLLSKPGGGPAKTVENTSSQISVEPLFNKKLLEFDYGDSDEEEDKEEQQHLHHNQQQRQPVEVPQQRMPAAVTEPNIFPKGMSDPNSLPKVVPDQNILPNIGPEQNFFPNLVANRNSLPKMLPDQNFFSNVGPDRNILPSLAPNQNFFPNAVPDRNIISNTMPNWNILPNSAPDRNVLPSSLPDMNILPNTLPDKNTLPQTVPDRNILPQTAPDMNTFPQTMPDMNTFPQTMPDRNILPNTVPDRNTFPQTMPDRNILPNTVPDRNALPQTMPDRNILPNTVPDQNFFPNAMSDRNILPKALPNQNFFPNMVPDRNILPKGLPGQNILQQVQQMSQQQEHLQSEIGAQDQFRRRLLEQQQQQFDREIEQESQVGHGPSRGLSQDQDRRPDVDQDDRENHDRAAHRRQRNSRDRSPRRRSRRSRSRSRDRDRDRRRRSRSRDRHRRSRSRERERREKERERRKVGLPPLKSNNIAICSTTIWFGRLTKHTTEEELREHIEKYGTIRTINMVPPRGCAFVCVTKRRDAFKVMDRMKGIKINGNTIKVAWAPGIGVKESAFKDSWDVDQGVTYIPWDKLPKDVVPLLAGGMVDEESLPDRLKGMKTGEEDEVEQQPDPNNEPSDVPREDNVQQQPPQPPSGMPGLPNFPPMPGQIPMPMMGPGGPLSLLSGPPPPIGMRPGMGLPNNMNSLGSMGNLNMNPMTGLMGPPPNMPGVRPNIHGPMPGMGPPPNMPGMGPRPMNMGPPQGPMMGGQANNMSGHSMDTHSSPVGVNSPGPRGPFGQFGNIPRFHHMQNPGGMHPFVNSDIHGGGQPRMEDSDMRAMPETMEWPPDDEVNAEDESDDDRPMDSDERMLPMGRRQHMPGHGMPNLQALGNPFGLRGPILQNQGPPMLGIPRAPSPNTGMPSLISLRMMPPRQQSPVIAISSGPGPGFALPPGSVRLSMPSVGVGQALMPAATSPHLIPTPPGAPLSVAVSVNGSVVVTRPAMLTINAPINSGAGENPAANTEGTSSEEDKLGTHTSGIVSLMQIHGDNRPPSGPILGRGFAPMTIRPRSGPGLLGVRPGAPGGGGFNRFGGSRPLMGPVFREMERPPFGNRFGAPLRPPVGFLDQDEREDRDERRPLPRIDDDQPEVGSENDNNVPKDIDERRDSGEGKSRSQDIDMRQDIDERPKSSRSSGRPSRWGGGGGPDETSKSAPTATINAEGKISDNTSGSNSNESISSPSEAERPPASASAQPVVFAHSAPAQLTNLDSSPIVADSSVDTKPSVLDDEGKVSEAS